MFKCSSVCSRILSDSSKHHLKISIHDGFPNSFNPFNPTPSHPDLAILEVVHAMFPKFRIGAKGGHVDAQQLQLGGQITWASAETAAHRWVFRLASAVAEIASGELTQQWKITIFNGKIHQRVALEWFLLGKICTGQDFEGRCFPAEAIALGTAETR